MIDEMCMFSSQIQREMTNNNPNKTNYLIRLRALKVVINLFHAR
jgi:hypothetical protein